MTKFLSWIFVVCFAGAVNAGPSAEDQLKYNPYFAKIGTTVYVSGPLINWFSELLRALPNPRSESSFRKYNADPSLKVERVVFVNATSVRPESTGGEVEVQSRMQKAGISTVVVGRCDLFCSRQFVGGVNRLFGQDLPGSPAHIDIQVPVDFDTKKLEPRYPATQLATYYRVIPDVEAYKSVLVEGLTKGGWTGGLAIPASGDVQFCETRKPETGCKNFAGVTALAMGFITTEERVQVDLPPRFPAPEPKGKVSADFKALPFESEGMQAAYKYFLQLREDRTFAISEPGSPPSWWWAYGESATEGPHYMMALKGCEAKGSKCRIYAIGDDVVWD